MQKDEFIIRKSINIKGTPAQVWDALTNPQKTKQYFYNSEVYSNWQAGSPITFKGELDGKRIELTGKIIEAVPGKLLKYSLNHVSETKSEKARGYSLVTDTIAEVDGQTQLNIVDDTGSEEGYNKSVKGWDMVLQGLKRLVESQRGAR